MGVITLSVIDMIRLPDNTTYRKAFYDLLKRKYLGEDVDELLDNLDYIYHIASNLDYYAMLYGRHRVIQELFRFLRPASGVTKLEIIADAYRRDRIYADELFDELVSFKRRLIMERAPTELVLLVNQILSNFNRKPEDIYRDIKHLVAMYQTWKELGDDVKDYLSSLAPSVSGRSATDTTVIRVIKFIYDTVSSGRRVTSTDIRRFIGNPKLSNAVINEIKKRSLADFDSMVRSWIPTKEGLRLIGEEGVDPEKLKEAISQ